MNFTFFSAVVIVWHSVRPICPDNPECVVREGVTGRGRVDGYLTWRLEHQVLEHTLIRQREMQIETDIKY